MYDVTFLIPDLHEEEDFTPPEPDDVMAEGEEERLFFELCERFVDGAFDPERELPF